MNNDIKKIVNDLFLAVEALVSEKDDVKREAKTARHLARKEMLHFLMYLSAADL